MEYHVYDLSTLNIIITSGGNITIGITGVSKDHTFDTIGASANITHNDWNLLISGVKNDMDKQTHIPRISPYTSLITNGIMVLVVTRSCVTISLVTSNAVVVFVTTPDTIKMVRNELKQNFIDWSNGNYKIVNIQDYK